MEIDLQLHERCNISSQWRSIAVAWVIYLLGSIRKVHTSSDVNITLCSSEWVHLNIPLNYHISTIHCRWNKSFSGRTVNAIIRSKERKNPGAAWVRGNRPDMRRRRTYSIEEEKQLECCGYIFTTYPYRLWSWGWVACRLQTRNGARQAYKSLMKGR